MMNKEGNEIVEAAIVLPIFILIILSLIGACVFQFNAMQRECEAQREIIDMIREEKSLIKRIEVETHTSSRVGGLYLYELTRDYRPYGYAIDEASMVRVKKEFVS